jgi:hypothetical protein
VLFGGLKGAHEHDVARREIGIIIRLRIGGIVIAGRYVERERELEDETAKKEGCAGFVNVGCWEGNNKDTYVD